MLCGHHCLLALIRCFPGLLKDLPSRFPHGIGKCKLLLSELIATGKQSGQQGWKTLLSVLRGPLHDSCTLPKSALCLISI